MKLFYNDEADNFFISVANLNPKKTDNYKKFKIEDFIVAFEENNLDIENLNFQEIIMYFDFYYLYKEIPIRVFPCQPAIMIKMLKANIKLVDDMLYNNEDFNNLLSIIEKRYYLYVFNNIYWETDNPSKRDAFRNAYTEIENKFSHIDQSILEDVFSNLTDNERKELDEKLDELNLGEFVTIYRGANEKSTDIEKAISWTLNKEVALFFANRFNLGGFVYKATVKRENIRWYFNNRKEDELIVFYEDIEEKVLEICNEK